MVITNNSLTEKSYKKLSIQVALNGLSFCCRDLLSGQITSFKQVDFSSFPKNYTIENALWKSILDYPELTRSYDSIVVLHENDLSTFVPKPLFDADYKGSYLQFNTKVFETDFFATDEIEQSEMINVYVPYVHVNNYLIDQFGSFEYNHFSTILVSKLLDHSKNQESPQLFVHVAKEHFEIVVVQNQKLLLYNSFQYKNADDFLYYLLFTAEQLHLNPESFKLFFLGDCTTENELYQKAYQYVRNTQMMEVTEVQKSNSFSAEENRKHFILFHS